MANRDVSWPSRTNYPMTRSCGSILGAIFDHRGVQEGL